VASGATRFARLPDYGDDDVPVSRGSTLVLDGGGRLHNGAVPARIAVDELDREHAPLQPELGEPLDDELVVPAAAPSDDFETPPGVVAAAETKRAMRGLFGRDSAYLVVAASQSALAALSIPITTRLLGTQFAVITTSLAVMQVLVAVGLFSLPTAIQRNYREADGGRSARRTITLAIITATITLVVAYSTGPLWAPALGLGTFSAPLRYAVIWASLTAVTFAAVALLRSRNVFRAYALISFVQSFLAEVFSVLLVVFVRRSAAEFIFGEMLMQVVAAVLGLYMTRPLPLRRRDRQLVVTSLKYAGGLLPAAVAGFLLTASDRIVIHHDLPADHYIQVARYGAVYNIASIPILLLGLLDPVWLPRFFSLKDSGLRGRLIADSRDVLLRLLIPTVLGLGLGVPLVLAVWLPGSYHPSGLVLTVVTISAGAFPMAGYMSANRVLLISGRTAPVGLCMVLGAGFNIAANIILVPRLGIEGAAVSTSAAYIVLLVLGTLFARRIQRLRQPSAALLVGSAVAIAAAMSCTLLPATGVFAVARGVLTLGCVVVAVAVLRDVIRDGTGRTPSRLHRRAASR
jgi:O-antigen/teichoic acid export membrane protein